MMITRLTSSELYTLFNCAKKLGTPLPLEIRKHIADLSDIPILLHHIAYGDLVAAIAMLEKNPRLVLQTGSTVTPSGLKVLDTTPLECALGAGDPEMAAMIAPFFDQFEGGEKVREEQYARYHPHIENMMNQTGYDFTKLLDRIIQSSDADITAALKQEENGSLLLKELLEELNQFRRAFTPGTITRGMHFNYQDLLNAYTALGERWDKLRDGDNFDKHILFCLMVIGYIQRSLPAVDRQVFAQGLYEVVEEEKKNKRSFKFSYGNSDFPITAGDSSRSGLGYEYFADESPNTSLRVAALGITYFQILCRAKISDLHSLCSNIEKTRRLGV